MKELFRDVVSDYQIQLRFLLLVLGLMTLTWLTIVATIVTIRWVAPGVVVRVEDSGALVVSTSPNKRTAVFLLTPNGSTTGPWIDTGIEVNGGEFVRIRASGRVCLAMHHMVEAGRVDIPPFVPWSGPNGLDPDSELPPRSRRGDERLREPYKLADSLFQGRLIGVISYGDIPARPKASSILDIGEHFEGKVQASGTLWLTVNEVWLSRDIPEAYLPKSQEEFDSKIVANKYWNAWFDDNAGSFLVTVEVGS